ncbi:hypothetical protein ElyMa_001451300 [Elysia marginata]|uniref:Uncharacterized protein n=1 Tax=Elysia marginata TaxID=1093978 RepID=A0AAV4IYK2_9GAST|nr:hypothetical protein ElyMa_001451300 [Elysia marginata]
MHLFHRFKNWILAKVPGVQEYKQGRNVLLSFSDDVGNALRDTYLDYFDNEAMCFARAAKITLRNMKVAHTEFDGSSFLYGKLEEAVPKSLIELASMILDGPNVARGDGEEFRQAALSTTQLLQYKSSMK